MRPRTPRRRLSALASLLLAPLLALAACGREPGGVPAGAEGAATPLRVVPGNASCVDLLVALADPGQVAAVPEVAFQYSVLADDPGPFADLPRVVQFSAEEVLGLRPDLVLVHDWQSVDATSLLEESGVAVLRLPTATGWDALLDTVDPVAAALGHPERGAALRAELEARRTALQEAAGDLREVRVLPYGNYGSGGSSAGSDTSYELMIELAGMRNAAIEAGLEGHTDLDQEQLLSIDPDLLLVGRGADEAVGGTLAFLRGQPALEDLRALREDHVVQLPSSLYSTSSLRLLDAAEALQREARAVLAK